MSNHRDVRKHARVAPVSVSERVNGHDTIVEPDGDLVRWVCIILEPAANLVIELP